MVARLSLLSTSSGDTCESRNVLYPAMTSSGSKPAPCAWPRRCKANGFPRRLLRGLGVLMLQLLGRFLLATLPEIPPSAESARSKSTSCSVEEKRLRHLRSFRCHPDAAMSVLLSRVKPAER